MRTIVITAQTTNSINDSNIPIKSSFTIRMYCEKLK